VEAQYVSVQVVQCLCWNRASPAYVCDGYKRSAAPSIECNAIKYRCKHIIYAFYKDAYLRNSLGYLVQALRLRPLSQVFHTKFG